MSKLMSLLFETNAFKICEENKPFWYTSGKIGPYFVNTHFLYGSENDANELLDFIRASDAFHVSIISDSCFSGAIFQHKVRGGGINAFDAKKSRYALTSGGMENVSDGKKGHLSPFAETLVRLLEENFFLFFLF